MDGRSVDVRHIDVANLPLPNGWAAKAQAAAAAVANGADPKDYDTVWRDLKDALGEYFHDKCWYCETKITRSDNAVDHFRPKGRVAEAPTHPGYRWLAFDVKNFRYTCTFCNSRRKDVEGGTAGGKADRFPLLNEVDRVYAPGPLGTERPVLLDPCHIRDHLLIGCKWEDGAPCPASGSAQEIERVKASIEILHLDYAPSCLQRHAVAVQFREDVEEGKRLWGLITKGGGDEESFNKVLERVKRAIDMKAQFSGDMRFVLKGLRSADHEWIEQLLMS
jgi:hypothetical protein